MEFNSGSDEINPRRPGKLLKYFSEYFPRVVTSPMVGRARNSGWNGDRVINMTVDGDSVCGYGAIRITV